MESIHKPEGFNCTRHINLREYFHKYKEELFELHKYKAELKDKIMPFFVNDDITEEDVQQLTATCDINNLYVSGEQKQICLENMKGTKAAALLHDPGEINDDSRSLQTVRKVEERKNDIDKNRHLLRKLRDRTLHIRDNRPEGKGKPNLMIGEDVVISIRMFRPFVYEFCSSRSEELKFDQEITLLGSNTLADFRDKIKCPTDVKVVTEISENPEDKINSIKAHLIYPSGFFFIDGIFYNDFRKKKSSDYSEVIRKWAEKKQIGIFETSEMDKTELISLTPRFGYPYVYQHQGRCEHIFIFSHAKLLSNTDPLHKSCYPYHSDVGGGKVVFCFLCGQSLPVVMVMDSDRLPQSDTPLCNECFVSYCYINGQKVGKFKAYPYVNRNAMF